MGLASDIRGIQNLGSWQANTSYKAEFVLYMLNHHKKNIVFLDSDAAILEYPALFNNIPEGFDLACHVLDKNAWYGNRYDPQHELLSGTAFFRYSPTTLKLVDTWISMCKLWPRIWEQQLLQNAIDLEKAKLFTLPLAYCWIASLPDGSKPIVPEPESVVIKHYQASRTLRNKVNL